MIKRYHVRYWVFIVLGSTLFSFLGIYQLLYSVKAIQYIVFSFDHQLSSTTCEAIEHCTHMFASDGVYNPELIIAKIPDYFPAVQSIDLQQFPQHMAMVTIKVFKPIVRINDDQVLLENKSIVGTHCYTSHVTAYLPKITMVSPSAVVNPTVMAAIERYIAEKIFDRYLFHIANEHEWYLSDTKDSSLTVCCNSLSMPIEVLQSIYDRLKKQVQKKGPVKTKWVADIRFRDQIILTMGKGGHYGS